MLITITAPTTDTTPILTVAEALQEFREQDPSSEPEAWERRIAAAERAFEIETGLKLRPVTIRAEGRAVSSQVIWLPIGPIRTITGYGTDGSEGDPLSLRVVGLNGIALATMSGYGTGYGFRGWLSIDAEVGFTPASMATEQPEIKQALLSLVGYWAESGREAAHSQTAPLGGPVAETPWTWVASLERWRLSVLT